MVENVAGKCPVAGSWLSAIAAFRRLMKRATQEEYLKKKSEGTQVSSLGIAAKNSFAEVVLCILIEYFVHCRGGLFEPDGRVNF